MSSRTTVDALELRISAKATDASASIGALITNLKALKEACVGVPESLKAVAEALGDIKGVARGGVGLADVVKELAGYNRVMAQAIRYANRTDSVFGVEESASATAGLESVTEACEEVGASLEEVRNYEEEIAKGQEWMAKNAAEYAKQQEDAAKRAQKAAPLIFAECKRSRKMHILSYRHPFVFCFCVSVTRKTARASARPPLS